MRCRETKKHLEGYIKGTLGRDIEIEVAAHLSSCAKCSREYLELKEYLGALSSTDRKKAPADLLEGIHAGIRDQEKTGNHSPFRTIMERLFIPAQLKIPYEAAGLLAIALVVILLYNPFDQVKKPIPVEGSRITEDTAPPVKSGDRVRPPGGKNSMKINRARIPDEEVILASKAVKPKNLKKKAPASAEITVTEKITRPDTADTRDTGYRIVLIARKGSLTAAKKNNDKMTASGDPFRIAGSAKRRSAPDTDKSTKEVEAKKKMSLQKAPLTSGDRSVSRITKDFGGTVLSSVIDPVTDRPRSLTVTLPARNMEKYMNRLLEHWSLKDKHLPSYTKIDGSVTIRIILPSQQN